MTADSAELLRVARDQAAKLLEALQQDQLTLPGNSDGRPVIDKAIDAARSTLDNLNRALQSANSRIDSD